MNILVTGGTGFVGSAVVRALLARDRDSSDSVRVLARRDSPRGNLDGLPVEIVPGDITTLPSLRAAVAGCDEVYHVAALYTFWETHPGDSFRVNVIGTHNVLRACKEANVGRIVYTSSVAALATPHDATPVSETTPVNPSRIVGPYKKSKYMAEQVALKFAASGLPVVIVNPTYPVGPRDAKPTPSGAVIVDFLNGRMPAYLDTGMNIADVDVVAQGHLLAARSGTPGERYILGGENISMRTMLAMLAEISGLRAPRVRLPARPLLPLAKANAALCRITGKTPRMTPDTIRMALHPMYFDSAKAVSELGYEARPAAAALEKAVRWYADNGYARRVRVAAANG
ncbi:NAD-dependent epimerase/dehydratase family protein [Candidatus Bipolaricaulota bacterium]|nr:NAD-dependent epimerase/dehydratase family protein [Candidatus Bipolaricaulota bacterium]